MGTIFVIISLPGISTLFETHFPNLSSLLCKILAWIAMIVIIYIAVIIIVSLYWYSRSKTTAFTSNNGHKVYVEFGDILNLENGKKQTRKNIVIPVNRCFDTIVDNDLISDRSVHGRFMQALYKEGKFTNSSLNEVVQKRLKENFPDRAEQLNKKDKRKGNLYRYPIGTIVELEVPDDVNMYFLLGLSWFDSKLKANTSLEEYASAVVKLIDYCNDRSQNFPVFMPLFGTTLSRTGLSKKEVLRFIVGMLEMNSKNMFCDVHIVIWQEDKDNISIINY